MKEYDIAIIGGGPGGYVAAIKASQMGAKTALIEKEKVGGVCLNWGCIPTKTLLKSAKVYHNIMDSEFFGIDIKDRSSIHINWPNMLKRKNQVVQKLTGGVKVLLTKNGVDTYQGVGTVIDSHTIEVNGETLKTKHLIIATGSSPFIPPIEGLKAGLKSGFVLTSKELLDLPVLPQSIAIIGGGVIGIEFATLFATLGTKVTVLEKAPKILLTVDDDIREAMLKHLMKQGIEFVLDANVVQINSSNLIYEKDGQRHEVTSDFVLASIGTKPNSEGLEVLNLKMEKKAIVTNDKLETSVPNVYAIGDVNGKQMLAHVASHEGIVAVHNIMGKKMTMNYDRVPACIYTFPEIASVGITEAQAKEKGMDYLTSTFPLVANGRALSEGETEGFIKLIVDPKYKEILGVHILSPNATEMISEAVITMELEGTVYELAETIHPHPTFSEIFAESAMGILGKPIHYLK